MEKTLDSPLDSKEIKPVNPQGNWSWIFIGRTNAQAEAPIFWLPHAKNQIIGKDCDAGKDWMQEGMTEDEMIGWLHQLDGHEIWASFRSWWWAGNPGVLQSMESQRVRYDWATELNWTELRRCMERIWLRSRTVRKSCDIPVRVHEDSGREGENKINKLRIHLEEILLLLMD